MARSGCARGSLAMLLLAGAALLLGGALPGWGWESSFFDWFESSTSARAAAMGGLHSALADDASVLFSNPAGLRSVDRQITISECTLNFYESALEIAGETLLGAAGAGGDRLATYGLWGPLAFTYVNKGRGFGVFSTSNVYLHATGPIPAAGEILEQNIVLIGARAFRIPLPQRWQSTLDVGLSIVGFAAVKGSSGTDFRMVLQSSANFGDLIANSGVSYSSWGAGVEFGLRYAFKDWLAFGLAGRNLALQQIRTFATMQDLLGGGSSTSDYNVIPLYLSAGFTLQPPLGRLGRFISGLVFAADYHDIFDFLIYPPAATSPWLHIGVGAELELLEIISLRAGYYQCLPSMGLGLDLTLFKLNLAYFGRERSREPGGYPIDCYTIGVEFGY